MSIPKVYIDTSVIGGCFDPDFAPWSNGLMKDFQRGHLIPIVSELVTIEIERAPAEVRGKYTEILEFGAYLKHKILGEKFGNDRLHIALATFYKADILVSWNFKHIVHFDKIRMFNQINQRMGYQSIFIYSPREVTRYEEKI